MKREGLFEGPAKKRAAVVRLNVGGAHFDAAPETLAAAKFFQAGLAGCIPMAMDENGRFFIDRSGKLFEVILEHMRNPRLRPSQKVLDEGGAALLAECEFYGYEELAQVCRGELLPGDLRPECRALRLVEEEAREDPGVFERQLLFDVHRADVSAQPQAELQIPVLLGGHSCPKLRGGFEEFKARLDKWSGGLLQDLHGMPGLVFAGGAVLGALTGCGAGDVDIFLRCAKNCTKDEAEARLRHVFRAVQRNQARNVGAKSKILVTRSRNAVTLFRVSGPRLTQGAPPVQVILRPYTSTLELLLNFDVDCCCFAWELDENCVVCTPRGLRALRHGCNIADTRFAGGGYCRRLEKYACRGFGIGVPGYTPSLVRAGLLTASYVYLEKHGLLLDVGRKHPHGKEMSFSVAQFDGLHAGTPEEVTFKVGALQHGRAVRNMHRLVVLDRKDIYVAHVGDPPEGRSSAAKAAKCMPMKAGSKDEFTLLWHTGDDHLGGKELAEEAEDGSEDYEPAPLAFVERLLEKRFENELEVSSEECGERCEAWLTGGGMRRLTDAMSKRHISHAYKLVSDTQASRLHYHVPLLFVYDFVTCEASFDNLRFVLDAGRPPLTSVLCEKHFIDIFGLPRKLSFDTQHSYASRSPIKWWDGVY